MTDLVGAAVRLEARMQNGDMEQAEYERLTQRGVIMAAIFGLLEQRGLVVKFDVGPIHAYELAPGVVLEADILGELHEMLELGRETVGEFKAMDLATLREMVLGKDKP